MSSEKQKVALSSVVAAIFLTLIKVIAGILTGSLGLLSEAAHSALDLGAAFVTFFAVKLSDKPADTEHTYGHGKIESFSALIETLLLLVTCVWIIYEAVRRLFFSETELIRLDESIWGIGIMVLSIIINISRARALKRTAKKYGSQALEADALHFDSDVWSSLVVIGGLICVGIGDYFKISALKYGDPIAALGVSALVIIISIQLGKRTIDVLLDTAPKGMINDIIREVKETNGVLEVGNVRLRPSGPGYFIELNVGISRNQSHKVVHSIGHEIRSKLNKRFSGSDIVISTFPIDVPGMDDREVYHTVKCIVDKFPVCTNIHNIHIYEVSGNKHIAIHLEVKKILSLEESHSLSHEISGMIQSSLQDVKDVSVNFEYVRQNHIVANDITGESEGIINKIEGLISEMPEKIKCHSIKVYSQNNRMTIFLHCELRTDYTTDTIEMISKSITNKIRANIDNIESVHIHMEPIDADII